MTLNGVPTDPSTVFREEDLVIKTRSDSTLNQQVRYWRNAAENALMRRIIWDAEDATPSNIQDRIVARNITGLEFDYEPSDSEVHTVVVTVTGSTPNDGKDRVIRNSFTIRNF